MVYTPCALILLLTLLANGEDLLPCSSIVRHSHVTLVRPDMEVWSDGVRISLTSPLLHMPDCAVGLRPTIAVSCPRPSCRSVWARIRIYDVGRVTCSPLTWFLSWEQFAEMACLSEDSSGESGSRDSQTLASPTLPANPRSIVGGWDTPSGPIVGVIWDVPYLPFHKRTRTRTPTVTPAETVTLTPPHTATRTRAPSPSPSPSSTEDPTPSGSPTWSRSASRPPSETPSTSSSPTWLPATTTRQPTRSATWIETDSLSTTPTQTDPPSATASRTPTASDTWLRTATRPPTASRTRTATPSPTPTATPSVTPPPAPVLNPSVYVPRAAPRVPVLVVIQPAPGALLPPSGLSVGEFHPRPGATPASLAAPTAPLPPDHAELDTNAVIARLACTTRALYAPSVCDALNIRNHVTFSFWLRCRALTCLAPPVAVGSGEDHEAARQSYDGPSVIEQGVFEAQCGSIADAGAQLQCCSDTLQVVVCSGHAILECSCGGHTVVCPPCLNWRAARGDGSNLSLLAWFALLAIVPLGALVAVAVVVARRRLAMRKDVLRASTLGMRVRGDADDQECGHDEDSNDEEDEEDNYGDHGLALDEGSGDDNTSANGHNHEHDDEPNSDRESLKGHEISLRGRRTRDRHMRRHARWSWASHQAVHMTDAAVLVAPIGGRTAGRSTLSPAPRTVPPAPPPFRPRSSGSECDGAAAIVPTGGGSVEKPVSKNGLSNVRFQATEQIYGEIDALLIAHDEDPFLEGSPITPWQRRRMYSPQASPAR